MALRLLLADDHVVVRRALRLLVEQEFGFSVVAEAGDGAEALQVCLETKPDVAVLDINMPVTNGITAAAEIRSAHPETGIVMLTFQVQIDVIRKAILAGAHGYVPKDSSETELREAIYAAAQGRRYIAQRAADVVVGTYFQPESDPTPEAGSDMLRSLSGRERQVLQMLAEGAANNRIAATLNLSPKTVETYRSRIMHKVGVSSFAELVRTAVKAGLVDRDG